MAAYGIGVGLAQVGAYYDSITASWAFGGGNGVIGNGVIQRTILTAGNAEKDRHDVRGPANLANGNATRNVPINLGYPSPGTRKSSTVRIATSLISASNGSDYGGSAFQASITETYHSWYVPKWNIANFKLSTSTSTSRVVTFANLDVPQNERLSWGDIKNAFYQTANGVKSGSFTISGMAINTKYTTFVGMVPPGSAGPYIPGTSGNLTVYPGYTTLTKGTITAERVQNTPSSIKVTWGAWGNFGNLTGWNAYVEILNGTTNAVVKSQMINVKTASNVTITGVDLSIPIKVRIRVSGNYHDGVAKNEYSSIIDLGYANNTWVKINGTWRRGIRTYVKINGVWRANNGLVKTKINGAWR